MNSGLGYYDEYLVSIRIAESQNIFGESVNINNISELMYPYETTYKYD